MAETVLADSTHRTRGHGGPARTARAASGTRGHPRPAGRARATRSRSRGDLGHLGPGDRVAPQVTGKNGRPYIFVGLPHHGRRVVVPVRGDARWCRAYDAALCSAHPSGGRAGASTAQRCRRPRKVLAVAAWPRLRRVLSLIPRPGGGASPRARRTCSPRPARPPEHLGNSCTAPRCSGSRRPGPRLRRRTRPVGMLPARDRKTPASGGAGASAAGTPAAELRLGYFPNITHAPALIGVAKGYFQQELGSTKLTTQTFNAGPDEVSALLGGSLDAGFIGSGPAINAFAKSNGRGRPADRRRPPRAARSSWSRPTSPRPTSSRARSSRRRRPATPRTSRSRSGSRRTTSPTARARTR